MDADVGDACVASTTRDCFPIKQRSIDCLTCAVGASPHRTDGLKPIRIHVCSNEKLFTSMDADVGRRMRRPYP